MNQKTDTITLNSVPNFNIEMNSISIIESVAIAKQMDKLGLYEHIAVILQQVSNLDRRQIDNMLFQDAIALLLYHRMYFWDNFKLVESPELTPRDFIHAEEVEDEVITKIGKYRFTNKITLANAINAENFANKKGHPDYLNFYIMASGCTKSLEKGAETIMSLQDTEKDKDALYMYAHQLALVGNVKVNLILDTEKINIVAREELGDFALGFHDSRIFEYGL